MPRDPHFNSHMKEDTMTSVLHALAVRRRDDRGQSTAEYALLLLGAATIALIVVTWATSTGKIGELFDAVVDSIIGKV